MLDPSDNTIGTATAAAAGANVVLETVPITTAGTYSLVVSGSGGTTGNYTLQAILNAVYKQATDSINTIGTAYDLSGAFASLGTTPSADRAGVLGTTDAAGDTDYYKYFLNAGQSSTIVATGLNGPVSLGLFDGNGNLLALPSGASLLSGGAVDLGGGFAGAGGEVALNGNAQINGSNLELTDGGGSEASSAFSNTLAYVAGFSTSFNFQITPGTNPTADGMTFTIQGVGTNALGQGGGGLGYAGIDNSVAIKFDLYDNAGEGIDSTGIYTDGAYPDIPAIDLTGTGIDLHSGDVFNVAMNYDGSTLNVTITDTNTLASASQSYSVNIPSIVGSTSAYVGFTGGTGGLTAVQNVQSWTFTPSVTNSISTAKSESINNFVASTSGWYYAGVSGSPGTTCGPRSRSTSPAVRGTWAAPRAARCIRRTRRRYVQTLEWVFADAGVRHQRVDLRRSGPAAHARMAAQGRVLLRQAAGPVRLVAAHPALLPVASMLARDQAADCVTVLCHGSDVWSGRLRPWRQLELRLLRREDVRAVAVSSFTVGALTTVCQAMVLPPGLSRDWFDTLARAGAATREPREGVRLVTAFWLADWRDKGWRRGRARPGRRRTRGLR